MSTKKVADLPKPCHHPEHSLPGHVVYEPGVYEHKCPGCEKITTFIVTGTYT